MNSENIQKSLFISNGVDFLIAHNNINYTHPLIPSLHPQYEIYYNIKGNDYFFIDGRFIKVKPYDLLIIPPLQIHQAIRKFTVPYDAYVINFTDYVFNTLINMPMLGDTAGKFPLFFDLSQIGKTIPYTIHLNDAQHEYITAVFEKCRLAEQSGNNLLTLSKFIDVLMFINKYFKNASGKEISEINPVQWSDKAIQHIEKHISTDITANEVADALFVNRSYLLKKFKEEKNTTLHYYITYRRLAEAQKLLYLGESVSSTALKTGFKTASHFTKTFKQMLGFTPGNFAKNSHDSYFSDISSFFTHNS